MVTEKKLIENFKREGYIGRNDYEIRDFRILSKNKDCPNKNIRPEEHRLQ